MTDEEKKRFIITDNAGFGEWDWDMLANEWEQEQLIEWGLDVPNWDGCESSNASEDKKLTKCPNCGMEF